MMRILTSEQIKAVEAAADESGISYLRLMENAGSACAKAIRTRFDPTDKRRVVALCGKGKNGGDGFVAARKLFENGYDVHVLLVAGEPKADNAQEMFVRLQELDIPVESYMPQSERQRALLQKADILIDAVFGTGFAGSLPENLQALFAFAETCGGFVVS
ncbi:MAG TPA: NAD(P)H-hydrate epimerase, partial [Candidatus Fimenecus stercoravium]|nr:NAD(P)H-hydrate epimerase [Candidatus Fimenecus stercoravium]